MPDSTNNYGGSWDLTIPAGDDTVDIVRDVGTLGVEVDAALSLASISSMIDVDAAGITNFGTTGPPLSLYGTSRPDDAGDDITSIETCLESWLGTTTTSLEDSLQNITDYLPCVDTLDITATMIFQNLTQAQNGSFCTLGSEDHMSEYEIATCEIVFFEGDRA